jgi:hypothetical protein
LAYLGFFPRIIFFFTLIEHAFARLRFHAIGMATPIRMSFASITTKVLSMQQLTGFFVHLGDFADHFVDKTSE